jgi:hypothetical protein
VFCISGYRHLLSPIDETENARKLQLVEIAVCDGRNFGKHVVFGILDGEPSDPY